MGLFVAHIRRQAVSSISRCIRFKVTSAHHHGLCRLSLHHWQIRRIMNTSVAVLVLLTEIHNLCQQLGMVVQIVSNMAVCIQIRASLDTES
jgi:hypothetical protein